MVRIEQARGSGRRVVLATASHRRHAEAVAAHLGLFDAVIATDERNNLSGARKLAAIRSDAGGAFDYVGNHRVDLPIWSEAAGAIVVTSDPALARRAAERAELLAFIREPRAGLRTWLRAVRIHQWAKTCCC